MDPLDKTTQYGETVLHVAADMGHLHVVQWLIEEGRMNPLDKSSKNGETALHLAAYSGNIELTKWLIEQKEMDPMVKSSKEGLTALHLAASGGELDITKWLIEEKGMDPLVKTSQGGKTALHLAAENRYYELKITQWLVNEKGMDPMDKTLQEGKTALHLAAENGNLELTQWLIKEKGMNPMVKTSKGETPYHLAAKEDRYNRGYIKDMKKKVMDYLKTFMSKKDQEVTPGILQEKGATPVVEDFIQKKEQSVMLNRLLGQGTYDSFDMRCMVTGQFGVGKSTLVKLLVGDAVPDERLATDGISLLEGRCGLDIDTREWILIDPETYNALDVVYNKVLMTSVAEDESKQDEIQEAGRTSGKHASDVSQQSEASKSTSSPGHIPGYPSQQTKADQSVLPKPSSSMHLTKEQSKKKMKSKMTKDEIRKKMEEILRSGNYKIKVGRLIFWDFGGQYVYYTTHQTFMTFRALFLLVIDGSKGLHDQVLDVLCFPGQHMIPTPAVFLQHWVNSILTYCKPVYKDIPKILLVATHKDKINEENVETRRKELYSEVEELFKDHEGKQHLVLSPMIFVNAKDKADPDIQILKKAITDLTFEHPCWGETMPNACVPLELEIAELVAGGQQILSLKEVEELNVISQLSVLSSEQLNDFLHFQHSLGKIVYFDTAQLREFVIISPLLLVEVMRSFVTDKQFWPSEVTVHAIFKKMSESGTMQRGELYQIWEQEAFSKVLPYKKYIFDMLIHLDIVSEQRRYNAKTGRRLPTKNFFVPCMVTERNTTNFMSEECTPNRAISLAFTFKGAIIPPALPNRLISACLSMWNVKTYKEQKESGIIGEKRDVKLLFSGFLGISYDKAHDIVVCVEANRIHLYIIHKTSNELIVSDIATSIKETFCKTLERIIEFYQSTVHARTSSPRSPFHIEYSCSNLECFISEVDALQTAEWICDRHKLRHKQDHWNVWNENQGKKQCKDNCPGLAEDALNQIPSDKELLQFSYNSIKLIQELAQHLEMEDEWDTLDYSYKDRPEILKFLMLMKWKQSNSKINFRMLADALSEMKITTHKLCSVRRGKKIEPGMSDDILDFIPTDEIVDSLASKIGQKFFQLGIELGLSIGNLETIQEDHRSDLAAQNKKVLYEWRKDRSVKPTIGVLAQALVNIGRGAKCLEDIIEGVDVNTLTAVEDVTDRILDNIDEILENIPISDILDDMMTHFVISADDRRRIDKHAGHDDQKYAMLEIVMKRKKLTYYVLVDALEKKDNTDLANKLKFESQNLISSLESVQVEAKGLSVYTDQPYKVRLQKNYSLIVSSIKHDDIVDHLITNDVLSVDEKEKIEKGHSQKEKNRQLMDLLLHKSEKGYTEFLQALQDDPAYTYLAEQIIKQT
ncbi:uncharacterized protein LOC127703064 isoform X4 [Mytilus californianus]|uniref:uncharacterized protein LOC127703064 isoform X4 n=2 Tax=Mytilus californianus TaxID=6549 RepID=UPI002245F741|nr:uncharacterized protein LOC127703064 isoform X4 [Mytilus californianus]